jgi:hypothetical protein
LAKGENTMAVEYIGKDAPDGACVGIAATSKVGFYGATPVVQQSSAASATDLATAITLVNALKDAVENLGLAAV